MKGKRGVRGEGREWKEWQGEARVEQHQFASVPWLRLPCRKWVSVMQGGTLDTLTHT